MAFITLLCVCLANWTHRAREQRRIVALIKRSGGSVYYDFQRSWTAQPMTASWVPRWLLLRLGVDYFHDVTEADVWDPAILPELIRFRRLKCLYVSNSSLTDELFAPVARLRGLVALSVYPNAFAPTLTEVGDESLRSISELPVLKLANVLGSRITPSGLEALARSTSLRRIQIVSNDESIDEDAAEPFCRAGRAHVLVQCWSTGSDGRV